MFLEAQRKMQFDSDQNHAFCCLPRKFLEVAYDTRRVFKFLDSLRCVCLRGPALAAMEKDWVVWTEAGVTPSLCPICYDHWRCHNGNGYEFNRKEDMIFFFNLALR